mmetsp:Transcript_16815/g.38545  ORF Transcript_16815/g.38545 Transcript_16815/m.38545 type:complete len:85 (+) Transcript_16815:39-293(+)
MQNATRMPLPFPLCPYLPLAAEDASFALFLAAFHNSCNKKQEEAIMARQEEGAGSSLLGLIVPVQQAVHSCGTLAETNKQAQSG